MAATSLTNVTGETIRNAIEHRDGRSLASLYAENAVTRVVDRNNPPGKPREIKGRNAIAAFWDDICSRTMVHKVNVTITEGNHLAFTQQCTYPDGAQVLCMSVVELEGGQIVDQTIVQAWDE